MLVMRSLRHLTLGGLEHFLGSDIPIYVHEEELKEAFWISKAPCRLIADFLWPLIIRMQGDTERSTLTST